MDQKQEDKINVIFKKITKYYGVEKEMPEVKMISNEDMNQGISSGMNVTGKYDSKTGVLYITPDFKEATVAHEMLHALSGDGVSYMIKGHPFGRSFNEGVTNLLSTKLYPFEDEVSVYEMQTHQAEMLAEAVGEDKLVEAYFAGDISEIRNDFNSTLRDVYSNLGMDDLEFSPFDIYTNAIDVCWICMLMLDSDPTMIEGFSSEADTIESMILVYGIKKGKFEEQKKIVEKLIQNEYMIAWSYYTNFQEMIS